MAFAVNSTRVAENDTLAATADNKKGWTTSPNGRGTWNIIWDCGFTIFLCSWSVLCLNVPADTDNKFQIFRRRVYITALSLLGPEFLFQIALGQWVSACRSVEDFHASNYSDWTMSHAFFADMGGFVLRTKDGIKFPIDAKQLHFLVTKRHISYPTIDKKAINDKNKVDGVLRLITLCQICWFVANFFGRVAQKLTITCLELTAVASITCYIGTALCWIQKPSDVAVAEIINSEKTMEEILAEEQREVLTPYRRTPLDFISRKEWAWSICWAHWINILRKLGIVFAPQALPVTRFENTISLELNLMGQLIFPVVTAVYLGIFITGWNYDFPTQLEATLWRAASISVVASLILYLLITYWGFTWYPALRRRFLRTPKSNDGSYDPENCTILSRWPPYQHFVQKAKSVAARIRNNSVDKDPALEGPLKVHMPLYIAGFLYSCARTYMYVADIIELRSLPSDAYYTVEWSAWFPHM